MSRKNDLVWLVMALLFMSLCVSALGVPPEDLKGGYDVKDGYDVSPRQEPLKLPPHPHPAKVSEGQWSFWEKVAGGFLTCLAALITTGGLVIVARRRKQE